MTLDSLQKEFRALADASVAQSSLRFFKTGAGEYGEGDEFLGIRVPQIRAMAKKHNGLPLPDMLQLLHCTYHEERLLALIMMVNLFGKADAALKLEIYTQYLEHTHYVNGWDLVDSSAHQIVGGYLLDETNRDVLLELARSSSIWERRISIISTLHFIKNKQFSDTLKISEILINDSHDLIQKAVGWMLREVGNRNRLIEEEFLLKHYRDMPRTMLRYAIEKFDEQKRQAYLKGEEITL